MRPIGTVAIGHPDWMAQLLPVSITREQVRNSPDFDTRKPVSRQHEARYLNYYGYPSYWGGTGLWGMGGYPGGLTTTDEDVVRAEMKARRRTKVETDVADDSHLRSCRAILGHHIHATDGEIGHIENVLVDEHTWAIRYLVVDTSNWWGGHHVLVVPQWIQRVSWAEATVSVDVTREAVKRAPRYDSAAQLDRQQETAIYEHYGRPGYWTTKAIRDSAADRG